MKSKRFFQVLVCTLLLCATVLNFVSCSTTVVAEDLMSGIEANAVHPINDLSQGNIAATDFALRLFKEVNNGDNTLLSPLSVMFALSMTANGASDSTLDEMEAVLGMSVDELNKYLYTYKLLLPKGEKYKVSIANSIWFTDDDRFTVNKDFLQLTADYYKADIYKAPFNKRTLKEINSWVKDETDGMIEEVLDDFSEDAIMYLINALAFEAEWANIYEKYQVADSFFTTEQGEKQNVELMYSELGTYLEDDSATGFIKNYKDGKYAFVALLPNEGISIEDYIDSLDGMAINTLLENPIYTKVKTAIPKFKYEFDIELSEVLSSMGMAVAFDAEEADFSNMGKTLTEQIYISRVIHKTFIEVGEKGTKAGAVTVVEMGDNSAAPPRETKKVYLDRPFVYMIIDRENNVPIFIGALTDMN